MRWSVEKGSGDSSIFFYLWVAAYIISFTYNFLWDIFMDWGLIDPKAPKDAPFLREEMVEIINQNKQTSIFCLDLWKQILLLLWYNGRLSTSTVLGYERIISRSMVRNLLLSSLTLFHCCTKKSDILKFR